MPKYQFRLVHRECGTAIQAMLDEMNALGQDGWYCVTQWVDRGWDYVMMQRELPASDMTIERPLPAPVSLGGQQFDRESVQRASYGQPE